MAHRFRQFARGTVAALLLAAGTVLMPARAVAAELGDYLWNSRPLLVFAPTAGDPRLAETMRRIDASRCDFVDRDMVLGRIVADGAGTLGGQVVDTDQARRLFSQFGIGANSFSVVLIGKDGGEKWRVNDVPNLQTVYGVIDGMPMRGAEMGDGPGGC